MKLGIVVAIVVGVAMLHSSGTNGQAIFGPNWLDGLTKSLGDLNKNIQESVRRQNQEITESLNRALGQSLKEADRAIENAVANGSIVSANGNNIVIASNGVSQILISGQTPNGIPYVRTIMESVQDGVLRHVEDIYYPKTNQTQTIAWTLDLNVPGAKPVPIVDDKA
nr:uncharacterized protein LOC117217439 isoform X1 [Megalopta genalis]